jgi:DNA-binding NarL/FixJ family response regulator
LATAIRILEVDDFEPWRDFIRSTITQQPDLCIAGEAADWMEALECFTSLHPDLVLLDMNLPVLNGMQVIKHLRSLSDQTKIVVVSEVQMSEVAAEALRAGANGYVVKSEAATELMPAIAAALSGKVFLSERIAEQVYRNKEH